MGHEVCMQYESSPFMHSQKKFTKLMAKLDLFLKLYSKKKKMTKPGY